MPAIGFGCAGHVRAAALVDGINAGYRLFDTAQATEWYLEEELGAAIATSGVARSSLFITSKLHPRDLGEQSTLAAFPNSLRRLRTDYLDAFMLHYPRCFSALCETEPEGGWRESWRALETLYDRGLVRAIGVCNFSPAELNELIGFARIKPHLVQSWMDPLHQERPLRKMCAQHGVRFQAYSSLGTQHRTRINPVLHHPVLARISHELGRSVAQIVLRWALQHNVSVIPRSTKRKHIESNLQLDGFELSAEQMRAIDALDGSDPNGAVPSPPPKACADETDACESWAATGECENNPGYMHMACAGSCGTCEKKKNEL
uniref:ShKT domain-containing protein n=2 Tax=Chrysotila carterae TaxID=13221 RepID=A0A7S4B0V3_CHRCT